MGQKLNQILKDTFHSFEMIFSNSPTPSLLVGPEGTVLCHNKSADQLFEPYPKNLRGLDIDELFCDNPSLKWAHIVDKCVSKADKPIKGAARWQALISIGEEMHWSTLEVSTLDNHESDNQYYLIQIRDCEREKISDALLKEISNKSITGYWVRNLEKQTLYTTPSFFKSLGYSLEDIEGWNGDWQKFVYSEDLEGLHTLIDSALLSSRESSVEKEIRLVHKNKSTIWHNAIVRTKDINKSGQATNIFGWFEELTTLRNLEKNYKKAKNEAKQANTAKSLFLANMSHEIRTPLNAIIGYTDLLVEEPLSGEAALFTSQIQTAGDHLKKIVDDILDYSKLEANYNKDDEEVFHLKDMVKDLIDEYKKSTHQKGITLRWSVSPNLPEFVKTNCKVLKETIRYLIDNAVKFTHKGGISFSVKGNIYPNGDVDLDFRIEDTGVGLAKEMWDRVFDPFMQADSSSSRVFGGTGLGLTIAKKNINYFNGDIKILESSDSGTKLVFNFVVQQADELAKEDLEQESREKEKAGTKTKHSNKNTVRILIAEDNMLNLQVLQRTLLALGYSNISCVDNGVDVLKTLDNHEFDLLLMDVHMPFKDGYTTTHEILSKYEENRPYIVGLSASAMPYEIQKGLDSGMDSYLTKPFRMDELLHVIERSNKKSKNSKT